MGCEVFKNPGFLCKFFECIFIIALALPWFLGWHSRIVLDAIQHLAIVCLCAVFYFFFPAFIMMIMYGSGGFTDNLYELIIAIIAASMCLLTAAFFLVFYYDDEHIWDNLNQSYVQLYGISMRDDDSTSGSSDSHETGVICVAVISIILMAVYVADAIVNGLQKAAGGS